MPRVRILSIHTLTKVLGLVKNVPCSDANIFPEYVLPGLAPLTNDPVILVRSAYAENIADLAQIALRWVLSFYHAWFKCFENLQLMIVLWFLSYIESSQNCESSKPLEAPKLSYETELQILRDMIQQTVSSLLADPENIVKITLAEYGITRLCVFFGKQKGRRWFSLKLKASPKLQFIKMMHSFFFFFISANDVLLSHLITFLNDKNDKQLRGSFFDCLVGVVSYVGVYSSAVVTPLLQQVHTLHL